LITDTPFRRTGFTTLPGVFPSWHLNSADAEENSLPATTLKAGTNGDVVSRIRQKRCRILVVDDEDTFRASLIFKLRSLYGATVEDAETGLGALDSVSANRTFDLILMDIAMPGMSGFEACKAIRDRGIQTQIALMSAYYDAENRAKAHALGITLLNKPLDHDALERILLECGGGEPHE
jgi:two-component system, chemotaxis family, chemotaxis protein CheY